ncbi:MAG: hypothetical protein HPY81_00325 [Firmicutes bacterium]|nr:hypothetical protein [Bacillota bacterium]
MRLIARITDRQQASFLIDSLRNIGFDRKDMIVADLGDAEAQHRDDADEVADELAFVKTERDGLWETGEFPDGIKGLDPGKPGIIVAVETSKHEADQVRTVMEQSGAVEIIQD